MLFGDGAGAVVLEAAAEDVGLLGARLGCAPDTRQSLHMPNWGHGIDRIADDRIRLSLEFDGPEIFRHAVRCMVEACASVLKATGVTAEDMDLFVPHQANLRIIQAVAKRLRVPMEKVVVRLQEYGNTSAASVPIALCDALEAGRVRPGATLLTATFGAGLTWGAGVIRWGQRITPVGKATAELPPCGATALELMGPAIDHYRGRGNGGG